jgi:hypothetical protein
MPGLAVRFSGEQLLLGPRPSREQPQGSGAGGHVTDRLVQDRQAECDLVLARGRRGAMRNTPPCRAPGRRSRAARARASGTLLPELVTDARYDPRADPADASADHRRNSGQIEPRPSVTVVFDALRAQAYRLSTP